MPWGKRRLPGAREYEHGEHAAGPFPHADRGHGGVCAGYRRAGDLVWPHAVSGTQHGGARRPVLLGKGCAPTRPVSRVLYFGEAEAATISLGRRLPVASCNQPGG